MSSRARILVLNQYYWPGVEATARLLAQLCEALARDYDVTVVTGQLRGHDLPADESRNGRLCILAVEAGFTWVHHEGDHCHVSIRSDSVCTACSAVAP